MSEKSLSMEMGNLVCRFGKDKVLLDLADEIVLPSFFDDSLVRRYDKTSYFFHEVSPVLLGSDTDKVIGIVGRIIKDTVIEQEQIFEKGKGLVKKTGSIRNSPSAMFLLILNNHRLIYIKETKDAPSKETFRSTLLAFLREKHKQYIDKKFSDFIADNEEKKSKKFTKKDLVEEYPRPTLDLISLASEDSIEKFVKQYNILKTVEISLSDRNDENDNDPFFDALQRRKDSIGSTNSVVKHSNAKGLNKDEAINEISEATAQGNQSVKLSGIDNDGDILRGNNEKFQLRKPLDNLSKDPKVAASDLYASFVGLVVDGLVKVPEVSQKTKSIIASLARKLF